MSQPSSDSGSRGKGRLKPSEVCARFKVQPYVLKFWEGEFPQLGRRLGTRRTYGPREIEIVEAIHALVEEQGLNLSEAREVLAERFDNEPETGGGAGNGPAAVAEPSPGATSGAEDATASEPASAGVMAEAGARIRELEKELADRVRQADENAERSAELERQLAEAEQRTETLVAQAREEAEDAAARRAADEQAGLQRELEVLREQMRDRLQRAESERDVAIAHAQELETALVQAREEAAVLRGQVDDLSDLIDTAGDAEQRLEAAREDSRMLRDAFEQERQAGRERDARLAREVATAIEELSTVGGLASDLLAAISGRAFEPSEADQAPEEEEPAGDPAEASPAEPRDEPEGESPDEPLVDDGSDGLPGGRHSPEGGGENPPLPRDGLF